jgi:hypothetical protein
MIASQSTVSAVFCSPRGSLCHPSFVQRMTRLHWSPHFVLAAKCRSCRMKMTFVLVTMTQTLSIDLSYYSQSICNVFFCRAANMNLGTGACLAGCLLCSSRLRLEIKLFLMLHLVSQIPASWMDSIGAINFHIQHEESCGRHACRQPGWGGEGHE